jgi:AAA+ ATPase superfamily predicted ATPase
MFHNREHELDTLEKQYSQTGSAFTVIYGRRRVGKTALVTEFIKDKLSVYYYATEGPIIEQIVSFTKSMIKVLIKPEYENIKFESFEQALYFLVENIGKKKLVLVFDEYQNLVKAKKSFSSVLQKVWDTRLSQSNIYLILCGSMLSMMYSETLSYASPLYGRRTSSIHLKPISPLMIKKFLPDISPENLMSCFASFGTVPKYLEIYDAKKSFRANIKEKILSKDSYLYNEARFLLKEEITQPGQYFQVLSTIASGHRKIGKIASTLHTQPSQLTRYLQILSDLGIVEKEVPVTETNPAKSRFGRYRIKDNFLSFWFYYVYRNLSQLEIRNVDPVLKQIDESFNQKFVSFAFEDYVKELVLHHPEKYLGFFPEKIGRWWNNKQEIDLVAFNDEQVAFIECKWHNQQVGYEVFQDMKRIAETLEIQQKHQYIIFAKKGFKTSLKESDCTLYSYLNTKR